MSSEGNLGIVNQHPWPLLESVPARVKREEVVKKYWKRKYPASLFNNLECARTMSTRRPIYINAASSTECCKPAAEAVAVTKFHQSLPNYSPTPLVPLQDLAAELGVRAVFVKDESNRFGLPSFKVLGASWGCFRAVAQQLGLSPAAALNDLSTGAKLSGITLIAATEGNHGRAVAFMARLLGIKAEIFVPRSMDQRTRRLIAEEGAFVVVSTGCYDQAVCEATCRANELEGALLIQDTAFEGYEDVPAWIVEGYSTMMNEAEQQLAQLGLTPNLMITPVGVGSLAHAVVRHCKYRKMPVSVVAVEPDSAPCLSRSLQAGKPITVETSSTIMDGMNCGTVSSTAWPDLQRLVDACVTVSSHESHIAVQFLASKSISAGPCGGASLAALRRLAAETSASAILHKDSVIVLLSTEGAREYPIPRDVSVDDVVGLTQILTRINSSNSTLSVSDGAGESDIADFISAWLAHRDIEFNRIEPVAGRPSIVAVLQGTGGGKSLMFNGHIDTVSLSTYEANPLSGALGNKDGREVIFGRGSLDMKGGLAAALIALASIKASGQTLRGDVIVAAVSDEEASSQGTQDILAAGWIADAGVVAEPTMKTIATAHKGFLWVEVEILGVAAHGSDPSAGVDAIMQAGHFLTALGQYHAKLPVDDLLGQASMHCGLIRGGEEPSSYPARCTITIEFRTVPAQTDESVLKDLTAMLQGIAQENSQFRYAAPRIIMSRPTQKLAIDHPLVEKAVSCGSAIFGSKPPIQSMPFWCDAALLGQAGIPSIVFGPEGAGLHSKEEWVDVQSLREMELVYTRLAQEFCC